MRSRSLQRHSAGPTARAGVIAALVASGCGAGDRPEVETPPAEGAAPRRIVSLIPAATEILFALGAGDRVVGRTTWGVHPLAAREVPSVGDGIRPSLEAVLARDPDLVIMFEGPDTEGVAARLAALGVESLPLRHNTLADLERNVGLLGEAVGCAAAADRLNYRVRADLERVATAAGGREPIRVYYDVWADPPMTIGRGSFLDSLITIAGGSNVFGDLEAPSPRVALESIVQRDPEVVVHPVSSAAGAPGRTPGERTGWRHVRAIEAGRVVEVDGDLLGRLGPRVGAAARALARALRSDVEMPPLEPLESRECAA